MATIERVAPPATAISETQRRLRLGARWVASFRGELAPEAHVPPCPEDVARGELFYNSTCCWV
jgi:hypothetical protein